MKKIENITPEDIQKMSYNEIIGDKPEESQGAIGNFFGNIVICLRIHSGNRNHAKTP